VRTYLLLKSLHIFGAILLLGNIIVTAWWKIMADRTRDPRVIAFAQRQVTLTDWVFTAPGALITVVAGDTWPTASCRTHGRSAGWSGAGSSSSPPGLCGPQC
jgi:uncharacterized membrane protein